MRRTGRSWTPSWAFRSTEASSPSPGAPPLPPAEDSVRDAREAPSWSGWSGLANHDNVGGIFRNAAAFGAGAVLLDPETCDPLYRKAIRVSVGGALVVPFTRVPSVDAMVRSASGGRLRDHRAVPVGRGDSLDRSGQPGGPPLLLGAEGPGLPPGLLARTRTVSIPMSGGFDSLNVATTSGIALHHLSQTGLKTGLTR